MAEFRLGILGGTFNPVHQGHLRLAESFRERLGLDRVLLVPAGTPPHKPGDGLAPALHRYAMVALAVAGHPALAVSDCEVGRPGPSYSVDTLERLAGEHAGARLFFLMGADTFLDLPTWKTPERLPAWAVLAVGRRAGSDFDPDGPAARVVLARLGRSDWRRVSPTGADLVHAAAPGEVLLVETGSLPVSAREIRRMLAAGESVRYLVPPAVADYIAQHRLYGRSEGR
jgi:nicotinate-nucleotide adenylyltransferase